MSPPARRLSKQLQLLNNHQRRRRRRRQRRRPRKAREPRLATPPADESPHLLRARAIAIASSLGRAKLSFFHFDFRILIRDSWPAPAIFRESNITQTQADRSSTLEKPPLLLRVSRRTLENRQQAGGGAPSAASSSVRGAGWPLVLPLQLPATDARYFCRH